MTVKNRAAGVQNARSRAKKRNYAPVMEDDGVAYSVDVDYPSFHTWRLFNQSGEILRGVCYSDSKRSYTFLHRHEVRGDWLSTTEHENLHSAIFQCVEWEYDEMAEGKLLEKDMIRIDDNEEHNMIRIMLQEEEYFGE